MKRKIEITVELPNFLTELDLEIQLGILGCDNINIKHIKTEKMRTINLSGPSGNAFALMGIAKNTAKQLGWEKPEIDKLIKDMMSGDYENLIDVFETNFGELIELRGAEVI